MNTNAYTYLLGDAASTYAECNAKFIERDVELLLASAKKSRSVPRDIVERLEKLYRWLEECPWPHHTEDHAFLKRELGEVLWRVWCMKRPKKAWLHPDAWDYIGQRLSIE